jgi:LAS superfamily LD-carboxypeptidase LdcB
MNELELTGRAQSHVAFVGSPSVLLHREVVKAYHALCAAAAADGIQLTVVSGFRSFERQIHIWNAKLRGERAILDRNGDPVALTRLSEIQLVEAALGWSALPGASRHHWGSDIDVYDAAVVPRERGPRLIPQEWATGGPFEHVNAWLEVNLESFGYYRPYDRDRGGVFPEPWHLSYFDVAAPAQAQLNTDTVAEALNHAELAVKATILANLTRLFDRYIGNVAPPPV